MMAPVTGLHTRRVRLWLAGLAIGLVGLWAAAFAGVAHAVTCATGTAAITTAGETCYTVPADVTSLQVVAIGASGGGACFAAKGAQVSGTLPVSSGRDCTPRSGDRARTMESAA